MAFAAWDYRIVGKQGHMHTKIEEECCLKTWGGTQNKSERQKKREKNRGKQRNRRNGNALFMMGDLWGTGEERATNSGHQWIPENRELHGHALGWEFFTGD